MSELKKHFFCIGILAFLVVILTFPLVTHINTHVPGFSSSQEIPGALWDNWRTQYSYQHHTDLRHFSFISYPFGVGLYDAGLMPYGNYYLHNMLSIFTTPVLTYNIQALGNMFLSALFMYLLMFALSGSFLGSLLSACAFAFCPYQFARQWQHLSLTFNWVFPMVLLALYHFRQRSGRKEAMILLIAMILMYSFDFHIIFFASFTVMVFLLYALSAGSKNRFILKTLGLWIIVFILLSAQFAPVLTKLIKAPVKQQASGYNTLQRKLDDLFTQSAKPLSYFIPSTEHPVFGGITGKFVGSPLWGVGLTEHQLYLGWTAIILAWVALKRWRKKPSANCRKDEGHFYVGYFVFLAAAAWVMSQPPWWDWGIVKIYMPSYFIYKVLPMIRAYCRFGIIVMLAVSALAGFGLMYFLERFKSNKTRLIVGSGLCFLLLFEFLNFPPFKVIDVSRAPDVYKWIKDRPGMDAIVEYPLDTEGANFMYQYYQIFHQKPVVNGSTPFTYPNKVAKSISVLSDFQTPGVLKWLGAKYVLVHRQDYTASELVEQIDELDAVSRNPGLRFVKSFPAQECPPEDPCLSVSGPIDVYEIVANPQAPSVSK
jgi:hypothetical protein